MTENTPLPDELDEASPLPTAKTQRRQSGCSLTFSAQKIRRPLTGFSRPGCTLKLLDRISQDRRAVAELHGIRLALERIADQIGASVAPGIAASSAFRSFYTGEEAEPPGEEMLTYMDDEDRAAMERQEQEELLRGGPAVPGFYEGDDQRVGSVVGPTVAEEEEKPEEQVDRETKE